MAKFLPSINPGSMHKAILLFLIAAIAVSGGCGEKKTSTGDRLGFDRDGMLTIDGVRTFIIGSYHLPKTDDPFATLAAAGFNYVQVRDGAGLDRAAANGLHAWVHTGSIDPANRQESIQRLDTIIHRHKDHPALLFWEMEDEPAFTWKSAGQRIKPARMQETYDYIKSIDRVHPVITNHAPVNLVSTLRQYNNATDLVACDIYPVVPPGIEPTYALNDDGLQGDLLNPYISQVGEYVDKMHRVVAHSKPVFMVLQGFAWEMLKKPEARDTAKILYPTLEQTRFMAYQSVVHGATGIVYWGTAYTPQDADFMANLYRVTAELAAMRPFLEAPTVWIPIQCTYHELGHSVDAGLEYIIKQSEDKTCLITVNADKNPVKVTLSDLDEYAKDLVRVDNEKTDLQNGNLTLMYRPFEAKIIVLE
jgi:hypothetical protein